MKLSNIEYNSLPDGEVEVRPVGEAPYLLAVKHRHIIEPMYSRIREEYPQAYTNLCMRYAISMANTLYFEFLVVKGFIKCNFGRLDNRLDIDEAGNFNLEYIQCPLAGECKEWKETCQPKRNNKISDAEMRVLPLIASGMQVKQIADILCISPKTVEAHTHNMLQKLNLHNNASLTNYYYTVINK